MKKMNVLNLKISFGIVTKLNIDPNFDNHIFIIFFVHFELFEWPRMHQVKFLKNLLNLRDKGTMS